MSVPIATATAAPTSSAPIWRSVSSRVVSASITWLRLAGMVGDQPGVEVDAEHVVAHVLEQVASADPNRPRPMTSTVSLAAQALGASGWAGEGGDVGWDGTVSRC